MSSTSFFTKSLDQTLANARHICQVAVSGENATGNVGLALSVVQTSGVNRLYKLDVPNDATQGAWKRLAPYDKTEKFPDGNWAVDMRTSNKLITLRLVRTKAGSEVATPLKCKVVAYAKKDEIATITDDDATDTNVSNAGVYQGALLTQVDGKLAINSDAPEHTLDVAGNVNTTGVYKIANTDVLTATTLGSNVLYSSLITVGQLQQLQVAGNVAAGNVSANAVSATHFTAGEAVITGNLSVGGYVMFDDFTADIITANSIAGTITTASQPFITSVGELSSLAVAGAAAVGSLTSNAIIATTIAGTSLTTSGDVLANNVTANALTGTLTTSAQPFINSVGELSSLAVAGTAAVGSLTSNAISGTTIAGTSLSVGGNASIGNVTTNAISATAITASSLDVSANVSAGNLSVGGKFTVNGAEWASSVVYGTNSSFSYYGPGAAYSNGISFYAQTASNGTPFVTAGGTDNSIFTFATAGTYMLQSETVIGYPWMPDGGDITSFFIKNADPSTKFGAESHSPENFSSTRPYLMTVNANDNVRFVIDSSSGNDYEAGIDSCRLTILKLA